MRMRVGLIVGFGAGYYLGAKAGRDRYDELRRLLERARTSEAYVTATEKARAAVDLGVERARDVIEDRRDPDPPSANGSSPTTGASSRPSSPGS